MKKNLPISVTELNLLSSFL